MPDTSVLVIPSFIAGMLTFFAPCTLPLVPGYLVFIGGASFDDLKDPARAPAARKRILINGALYVVGFSVIFIAFGAIAGTAGSVLGASRIWLTRIGGVLVILFGLMLMGILTAPFLNREWHAKLNGTVKKSRCLTSLLLGASFATGWTPCVGPILGSVLLLASTSTTALSGAFLLAVFSLGLAIPFLMVAWGIGIASRAIAGLQKTVKAFSVVGGIALVGLGILLTTNQMARLISWGYRLFSFINYERILDYL